MSGLEVKGSSLDRLNKQVGFVLPGYDTITQITAFTPTAGWCLVYRFTVPRPFNVATIGFVVGTAAGADDTVDVAILDAAYNRLRSAGGAVAGKLNSTGQKAVSLTTPYLCSAGVVYYAALSFKASFGGTAVSMRGTGGTNPLGELYGAGAGVRELGIQTGVGDTIPSALASVVAGSAVAYLIVSE
jgi:hypothetical protein